MTSNLTESPLLGNWPRASKFSGVGVAWRSTRAAHTLGMPQKGGEAARPRPGALQGNIEALGITGNAGSA